MERINLTRLIVSYNLEGEEYCCSWYLGGLGFRTGSKGYLFLDGEIIILCILLPLLNINPDYPDLLGVANLLLYEVSFFSFGAKEAL